MMYSSNYLFTFIRNKISVMENGSTEWIQIAHIDEIYPPNKR